MKKCQILHSDYLLATCFCKSTYGWQNDYIFVNKNVMNIITDCEVINSPMILTFSDHYPVTVDIGV